MKFRKDSKDYMWLQAKEPKWTDECDHAFHTVKMKLVSAPIHGYPDSNSWTIFLGYCR